MGLTTDWRAMRPLDPTPAQGLIACGRATTQKLRPVLQGLNITLSEVDTGLAVLCYLTRKVPSVILIEQRLPLLDGLQVTVMIRRFFPQNHPRIILCAESADLDDIVLALSAGADDYILPPYDRDLIAGKFETLRLIERFRPRQ